MDDEEQPYAATSISHLDAENNSVEDPQDGRGASDTVNPGLSTAQTSLTTTKSRETIVPNGIRPHRFVRILSIDAGGAGIMSSLAILRRLLDVDGRKTDDLYPCQHFELICGSEWGGVLAVMLGRMRMNVRDCEKWFEAHVEKFHLHPIPWYWRYWVTGVGWLIKERTEVLRAEFEQLLASKFFRNTDGSYKDFLEHPSNDSNDYCRTLVYATDLQDVAKPKRFTSYESEDASGFSVLDVMMAALPLPAWMLPTEIPLTPRGSDVHSTKRETSTCFSASAMGLANPSFQALIDAVYFEDKSYGALWKPSEIHSLVSIGTGIRDKDRQLDKHLGTSLWAHRLDQDATAMYGRSITDTERTHFQLERFLKSYGRIEYHRFNARDRLVSARIGDWRWTQSESFKDGLAKYIDSKDMKSRMSQCHKSLRLYLGQDNVKRNSHQSDDGATVNTREPIFPQPPPSKETSAGADEWISEYGSAIRWLLNSSETRIRIALLDTGVQATHPDICRMWGIPIDENRNNWLQDRYADFSMPGIDHMPGNPQDTAGHGTEVAGILLQLAPNAELYIGRISDTETVRSDRVVNGIRYALDKWNVQVICLALGFIHYNRAVERELIRAAAQNCVVIASASNKGLRSTTYFPARSRYAICARSADHYGQNSEFNPPPEKGLNFAFLGEGIATPCIDAVSENERILPPRDMEGPWKRFSGTSAAAATASAIAVQIMDYGARIGYAERVECQSGIEHVFKAMHFEPELLNFSTSEQVFVVPSKVLGNQTKASERMENALDLVTLA